MAILKTFNGARLFPPGAGYMTSPIDTDMITVIDYNLLRDAMSVLRRLEVLTLREEIEFLRNYWRK